MGIPDAESINIDDINIFKTAKKFDVIKFIKIKLKIIK
tara:strand:- start:22 stop:135 length:114 start_codon:yes stop_codon:yes gene_type:complete